MVVPALSVPSAFVAYTTFQTTDGLQGYGQELEQVLAHLKTCSHCNRLVIKQCKLFTANLLRSSLPQPCRCFATACQVGFSVLSSV